MSRATDKTDLQTNRILVGDVRRKLDEIPADSIDCVITSPPYFRLRNYQHAEQIGLEQHVETYVQELRLVARGLKRVLKDSGSLWLNLGDTYSSGLQDGAERKSLLLVPERVALALQADGWILRNKVIWAKPNPMPTSVGDRLSCTHEVIYFFTTTPHYFFDLDAIRVPCASSRRPSTPPAASGQRSGTSSQTRSGSKLADEPSAVGDHRKPAWSVPDAWRGPAAGTNSGLDRLRSSGQVGHPLGKNPGDVWNIATAGFRGAHHAVFPPKLVERPLLATCPKKVCSRCGRPWTPEKNRPPLLPAADEVAKAKGQPARRLTLARALRKSCTCRGVSSRPGVVLDPFFGAGTTGLVAEQHGREWIGIEVNPAFAGLAEGRIAACRLDADDVGRKGAA